MENPWLHIPLADYESHMALPHVGQDRLLADIFAGGLARHAPASVAVLGCAGGNGFACIDPRVTQRVVGVDLNPEYIARAQQRFAASLPQLQLFAGDVQTDDFPFAPVDLVYAALLFEYVKPAVVLARIANAMLRPDGRLLTVVQLPAPAVPEVTPSPYLSLRALKALMCLVPPEELRHAAQAHGMDEAFAATLTSSGGKRFCVQEFRRQTGSIDSGEARSDR